MQPGFQRQAWINGAGDDWFSRNKERLGERDVASEAIEMVGLRPTSVLEIGCANGWRLRKLKEQYGCAVAGVDVSAAAIQEAPNDLNAKLASADKLPFADNAFDMVIYGFCLCFIGPEDYLPLVQECDRVLKDGGYVVIYDFYCTAFAKRRIMNLMKDPKLEKQPVYLYNYNWPLLWTGHPAYHIKNNIFNLNHAECCTIIQKDFREVMVDYDENGERVA